MIKKSITVGIVVSSIENKGPINVVRAQITNSSATVRYVVISLTSRVSNSIVAELEADGATIVVLGRGGMLSGLGRMRTIVREYGIDVLHSHGAPADLFVALAFTGAKKMTTIHNCLLEDYLPLFGRVKGSLVFLLHVTACAFIPTKVACSVAVGRALTKHRIPNTVIPNGVNGEIYKPAEPAERANLRQKWSMTNRGATYVYCGSFIKRKNVEYLIRNLSLGPEDLFVLVGEGELLASCRGMVSDDPRYRFLGQVQSCSEIYKIADFFVSASFSEGLPLAVLEAYSCGANLILSDIPSHREVAMQCAEGTVTLFDLNADFSIDLPDPGTRGAARDVRVFSSEQMRDKYETLYATV